jgi:DNA-directed RNA polymerase subunit E"
MSKKVCKDCKRFYTGSECPNCKSSSVTDVWKGRFYILDTSKSEVAKNLGINLKGEYAIKVR